MTRRPPRSTRTDTLFPYTTLFLSPINLPSCIYGPAYADELAAQADRGIRTVSIPLDTVQYDEPWMFTNILSARFGDITVKYIAGYSGGKAHQFRSEEHTSELQSLMRISYAVFCLKKKIIITHSIISHIKTQKQYHHSTHTKSTPQL